MIENALIIALIVLFLNALTWEGMILDWVKKLNLPKFIAKPLYSCPICMTPWWGSVLYWLIFRGSIVAWLITIAIASGFSVISAILIHVKLYCDKNIDSVD